MKVCHFIASKGLGRGEAYIDLVNALCATVEIVLLVPDGALFIPRVAKRVQIVEYRAKDSRRNPLLYFELYTHLKKIRPDIVHTHFAKATEIFYWLNKRLNIPWVSTKHNPRKGRIFNKADHVIAVSKGVADSISHNRVTVIHNGITPEILPPVTKKNKIFTIVAVGRLEKVKAFDRLISECAKLSFDFRLQIVGDGPEKENLESLAISSGIDNIVDFLGYRSDIPQLMQNSDVIVVTSHSEGFSLVILEGLFYGKILISRDVGIARSILSKKFMIEKYEIASKLEEIFANIDFFEGEFGAIKKLKAPNFLIEHSVREYLDFYHGLLP